MPEELALLLRHRIEEEYPVLNALPESVAAEKPTAKWSRKEEMGHLIDSAANNHLRFVRAALDGQYRGPGYDQDRCVALHGYQRLPFSNLVSLWRSYNLLLAELIQRIPANKLDSQCFVGENQPVTLKFLIEDYVLHLRHHVDHILRREKITPYPAA
jgi:hypothetical protein